MARRTRSPHPGVVLIPPDPDGRHPNWRARCEDPDTGGRVKLTLDPLAIRTAEARRDWAIRKSKALAKRRLELEGGAPRATSTALETAVGTFFEDRPDLRESTRKLYRLHADTFLDWAKRTGIETGDDLTRANLIAFRASRLKVKLSTAVEGGTKGEKEETNKQRAPSTVNVELRSVRAVLNYARSLGLAARITLDDLTDGLKALDAPRERIEVLKRAELRKLLEAATRHDSEPFAATRAEHAGEGEPGSTLRYPPIAPFVACVLLSGMRLDEALSLTWEKVDLESGEIQLTTATKTKRPRDIHLSVSPALVKMLVALKPKKAEGSVFSLSRGEARSAERRLANDYDAPAFTWQALRQTCGSYLTNAPAIYGAAAAFQSAQQLGHSVQVAERHYLGRIKDIPATARTLESAMGVEEPLAKIIKVAPSVSDRVEVRKKRRALDQDAARATQ